MPIQIISSPIKMIAYLSGEIDHHTAAAMREELDEVLIRQAPQILCLDFGDVSFMDSSGVGLVMGRFRSIQSFGGRLEVVNLSPQIFRIMKMSGLEKLAVIKQKDMQISSNSKLT